MLSFEQAREKLLGEVTPLAFERIPVAQALGRVLAEPLVAGAPIPAFPYSAMDGFALATSDLPAAEPWLLPVSGESRAGRPAEALARGAACRISTGAELPPGADAVIPRELATETQAGVQLAERPRSGQHVRRAGEDLEVGAVALARGVRLGAGQLGLALSLDVTELAVARRPRVTVLCTGDELRPAGSARVPGKIPESVSLPVASLAALAGAVVRTLPPVPDAREATERAIAAALVDTDLLVTVGGVSVGDHDWVRPSLEAQGVELEFWKVAIKPGKPIVFGRRAAGTPLVLGLPGNPASALVTFSVFGMPLLRALQGDANPLPRAVRLPLASAFRRKAGRLEFLRVTLQAEGAATFVVPLANQASGALTSLAWADALALIPADAAELAAGALVDVLRLESF